eukprot:tig00022075_g23570.t1
MDGRLWEYDDLKRSWSDRPAHLRIDAEPFAEGTFRRCYKAQLADGASRRNCVAKRWKDAGTPLGEIKKEAEMQFVAQRYAAVFNEASVAKVAFVPASVFQARSGAAYLLEEFLDGTYEKYNNNNGVVPKGPAAYDRMSAQAFSHFTLHHSRGRLLVCDLQGVPGRYTDPQIHGAGPGARFGPGDCGTAGIVAFLRSHKPRRPRPRPARPRPAASPLAPRPPPAAPPPRGRPALAGLKPKPLRPGALEGYIAEQALRMPADREGPRVPAGAPAGARAGAPRWAPRAALLKDNFLLLLKDRSGGALRAVVPLEHASVESDGDRTLVVSHRGHFRYILRARDAQDAAQWADAMLRARFSFLLTRAGDETRGEAPRRPRGRRARAWGAGAGAEKPAAAAAGAGAAERTHSTASASTGTSAEAVLS